MKIEEFFQSVNKDDLEVIKNTDKELLKTDRESFDNYFISTYLYKINDSKKYKISISDKKDNKRKKKKKKYNDYQMAYEDYDEMYTLGETGNLYEIKEKIVK